MSVVQPFHTSSIAVTVGRHLSASIQPNNANAWDLNFGAGAGAVSDTGAAIGDAAGSGVIAGGGDAGEVLVLVVIWWVAQQICYIKQKISSKAS